jgi:DNA polymerase-3 subunit delta'
MSWNNVIGQERVKNLLRQSIERRQLSHAYLFYGNRGVGKQAMAIEFARTLLCARSGVEACGDCGSCRKAAALQHPDLELVFPLPVGRSEKNGDDPIGSLDEDQVKNVRQQIELKSQNLYHQIQIQRANFVKINSVRSLKRTSSMTSVEGSWKVFLIFDADQMNAEASNSLLKTLEEPTDKTLLVLTSSEKDRLLPTIVSRCQLVQFSPLADREIAGALQAREAVSADEALLVAALAQGSYSAAIDLLSDDLAAEHREVLNFVRVSLGWKELSLTEVIDALASPNDRKDSEHWLRLLETWLRDALVLREVGSQPGSVVHDDKDMSNFVQKFPRANLERAIQCVEDSIALVRKNVYLHLIFASLSFNLRTALTESNP